MTTESDAFVFFGATGDLAYKKIFPALYAMVRKGNLHIPIIGMARAGWTLDKLRERARDSVQHNGDFDEASFAKLAALLRYVDGLDEPGAKEKVKILATNPFQTLDREGVGQLVRMAVEKGRKANPHLELGICGEHGGDPNSVEFCHMIGLDYVSCSPYRVPVARLAAAQAALSGEEKDR